MSQGFRVSRLRQRGPSQYAFGTEEPTGIIMQNAYGPPWCVKAGKIHTQEKKAKHSEHLYKAHINFKYCCLGAFCDFRVVLHLEKRACIVGQISIHNNKIFSFNRKLSGSKVRRLLPRLVHRHPPGWFQESGQRAAERGQGAGVRWGWKRDLQRVRHVHRPRLGDQEALLRDRNRLGSEDNPHRCAPALRRPERHREGAADVGHLRQPGPTWTKSVRVRRRAKQTRARDRKTDLHAGARGLVCAGDPAGDHSGGSGPCVLLRSDRRPRPGALGPGTCPGRPLAVLVAFQLPTSSHCTERRSALVLQDPLSIRNMALGQPLDPSTWDVSIPELKPQPQEQNET